MHRSTMVLARRSVAITAALLAVLAGLPAQPAVAQPPTLSLYSQERAFSPDGDGVEDDLTVQYLLGAPANVTVTVRDAANRVVAVPQQGVSQPARSNQAMWNGTTTAGARVSDGPYTMTIEAENAEGSALLTYNTEVDRRPVARIVSPQPGSSLAGEITAVVEQASDIVLSDGRLSLAGCQTQPTAAIGADGRLRFTIDTTTCQAGARDLEVAVGYADRFNARHSRNVTVPVTVLDQRPPSLDLVVYSDGVTRTAADQVSRVGGYLRCSDDGAATSVSVRVLDPQGRIGRDLIDSAQQCNGNNQYFDWDGADNQGTTAAAPTQYELVAVATDDLSQTSERRTSVIVDRRIPARIVTPAASPTVTISGPTELIAAPTTGVTVNSVSFHIDRCSTAALRQPDDRFAVTTDLKPCSNAGRRALLALIDWVDAFGRARTYQDLVEVEIADTDAPQLSLSVSSQVSLYSPGQLRSAQMSGRCFDLSGPPQLSLRVLKDGVLVRTVPATCAYYETFYSSWDGLDDEGNSVADGLYEAVLTASDAGGVATATAGVRVDRRTPVVVTEPSPGAVLTGRTPLAVRAPAGTVLTAVNYFLPGCPSAGPGPGPDGTWPAEIDTSQCRAGNQQLNVGVSWRDAARPDDQVTSYSVSIPVTIADTDGPVLSPPSQPMLVALNAPGQPQAYNAVFSCSDRSTLASAQRTVLAADGTVVAADQVSSSPCLWSGALFVNWDGRDSSRALAPDGDYDIVVTAVDQAGNSSTATHRLVVLRVTPGNLSQPQSGGTLAGTTTFTFTPDTATAVIRDVGLYVQDRRLEIVNASSDGRWRTSLPVSELTAGPATVSWWVSWTDRFDGYHFYSGDTRDVTVDPAAIPLSATLDVSRGRAPLDVSLTLQASDSRSRLVELDVDWGDGSPHQVRTVQPPYSPLTLSHRFAAPGTPLVVVTATNGAGGRTQTRLPVIAEGAPNQPPVLTAADVSPVTGAAPHDVAVALQGSDPDGGDLRYRVDYGDGTPVAIGRLGEPVPGHRYVRPGTYLLRSSLSDGALTSTRTTTVTVVLPEPLTAGAGDDQEVVLGTPVVLDAAASRPAALIDAYDWDFGDGKRSSGTVVSHTYDAAGLYTVRLTTRTGTTTASDTNTVRVAPVPVAPGLRVAVRGGGLPLAGAQAVVVRPDASRVSGTAGPDGQVRLDGLPDGPVTVYAIAPGHKPRAVQTVLSDGAGAVTIELVPGVVGTATLASSRLSVGQAIERGLDVQDEANFHVYEAKVHLYFDPESLEQKPLTPVVGVSRTGLRCLSQCGAAGGGGAGTPSPTSPGCFDDLSRGCFLGDSRFLPTVQYVQGEPFIHWLVLPIRARFLKELFDVRLIVQNVSDVTSFEPGVATLELPAGLSLAGLTTPQSLSRPVAAIPAGGSRTVDWVVRGDVEGDYLPAANYSSIVAPFDQPVQVTARAREPLKVWAGAALKTVITVDRFATRFAPYSVTVTMQNVTRNCTTDVASIDEATVYNLTVELLDRPADSPDTQADYVIAPTTDPLQGVAALAPCEIVDFDYVVYPGLGTSERPTERLVLVQERSFIQRTGGTVDLMPELRVRDNAGALPALDLRLGVQDRDGTDTLFASWDPTVLPDSDQRLVFGYQLYARSRLRGGGPWKAVGGPVERSGDVINGVRVPGEDSFALRYYTVETLLSDGSTVSAHRLGTGPSRYVALGDSFSSGEGVPAFEPGTAADETGGEGNACHRSSRGAYGRLVLLEAGITQPLEPSTHRACSGAVTQDLLGPNADNDGEPPQIDWLNDFTEEVSLTTGGNDAAFSAIAKICVIADCGVLLQGLETQQPTDLGAFVDQQYSYIGGILAAGLEVRKDLVSGSRDCKAVVDPGRRLDCLKALYDVVNGLKKAVDPTRVASPLFASDGVLRARLANTYRRVANQAPRAQVRVLTYPQLVTQPMGDLADCDLTPGLPFGSSLSERERFWLIRFVGKINEQIRQAVHDVAAETGQRVRLVDVTDGFAGRELCRGGTLNNKSAFNSVVNPIFSQPGNYGSLSYSFHPNADGQELYKDALVADMVARPSVRVPLVEGVLRTVAFKTVRPGDSSLRAQASIAGSTVSLDLLSPSGQSVTAASPGAVGSGTPVNATLVVPSPEPGVWAVRVLGRDLEPGGETALVIADVTGPAVASPTASVTRSTVSDTAFALTATSTGLDNPLYSWDFSDETSATGREVRHDFGTTERRVAYLIATGTDGQVASSRIDLGTYTAPEVTPTPTPTPDVVPSPSASPGAGPSPEVSASLSPAPTPTPSVASTPSPATEPLSPTSPAMTSPPATTVPDPNMTSSTQPSPAAGPASPRPQAVAGLYHPLPPARVSDSRPGRDPIVAGRDRVVQLTGRGGVPTTGAVAVVLNLTAVAASRPSDLQVFPTGRRPGVRTSNLNLQRGAPVATMVTAVLGAGGSVSLSNAAGTVHVVVDVLGWYAGAAATTAGLAFNATTPVRVLDTRTTRAPVVAGDDRMVQVAGLGAVPGNAAAVVVNVTAVASTAASDLAVTPAGSRPAVRTSTLNLVRGPAVANLATVQLDRGGLRLATAAGSVHVVLDVVGWYAAPTGAGGRFHPLVPTRVLDTRPDPRVKAGADRLLRFGPLLPPSAVAVVGAVTVVGADRAVDLAVYPDGRRPAVRTSNVNAPTGLAVPNSLISGLGDLGVRLSVSSGSAHVLVDVAGWFGP